MPAATERTPREKETLMYKTPEQAQEFVERVEGKVQKEIGRGVKRQREVVAEEAVAEMMKHGEGADTLSKPWEHTKEEHKEVQQLVDLAFDEDLPTALKKAQESDYYPRNIDLFHDVLTGQLYEILQGRGLNKQQMSKRMRLAVVGVVVFVLTALALLLFW